MTELNIKNESDKLRQEAKETLNKIFLVNNLEYTYSDVDRIVDCIISATVLDISAIIKSASIRS